MYKEFNEAVMFGEIAKVKEYISKNPEIVHERGEYGFTALHTAVGEENQEIIKLLIESGIDINIQTPTGIAPLHSVCSEEIAKLLIELGADIEIKSNIGDTPLIVHATEAEHENIMAFLLESGANPHAKNNAGKTAMDYAKSRKEFLKEIILTDYLNSNRP